MHLKERVSMDRGKLPTVHASFSVVGLFDPDAITRVLGVDPSFAISRTETTAAGATANYDVWLLKTDESQTMDGTSKVGQILERLRSVSDNIATLRLAIDAKLAITLVATVPIFEHSAIPNLELSPPQIEQLGALGAHFELDVTLET
jgi:hypothetical protein